MFNLYFYMLMHIKYCILFSKRIFIEVTWIEQKLSTWNCLNRDSNQSCFIPTLLVNTNYTCLNLKINQRQYDSKEWGNYDEKIKTHANWVLKYYSSIVLIICTRVFKKTRLLSNYVGVWIYHVKCVKNNWGKIFWRKNNIWPPHDQKNPKNGHFCVIKNYYVTICSCNHNGGFTTYRCTLNPAIVKKLDRKIIIKPTHRAFINTSKYPMPLTLCNFTSSLRIKINFMQSFLLLY